MSSLPPDLPPPPPPPPPPSGYVPPSPPGYVPRPNPLPWEDRPRVGFADALVDTVRLFVSSPREAWSRTREKGDLGQPLLFAVCVGWIGIIFNTIWGQLLGQAWIRYLPPNVREHVRDAMATSGAMMAFQVVLAPLFVVLGVFIMSAVLHLCFLVVGALSNSTAGFEGTVRVVGYSWVAQLGQVVPVFGGLIALVGSIILASSGAQAIHRTSQGKAVFGVLLPVLVCCACVMVSILIGGAALFNALGRMR